MRRAGCSGFSTFLLLFLGLLLATKPSECKDAKRHGERGERHPRGNGQNDEYEAGFERLSDVKNFEPVRADGEKIEPEEYGAQFSIVVPAREELCFFQPAKKGSILQVQFQVESGGEQDIDLIVYNPEGKVILQEMRSQGNMDHDEGHDDEHHTGGSVKILEAGDYRICFSNRFSTLTSKQVYMDVGPVLNLKYKTRKDDLPASETDSMTDSLDSIQGALDDVIALQLMNKRKHRIHMELAESNNDLIVLRSIINILLMIGSVSLQIYFIRLLFKAPSKA